MLPTRWQSFYRAMVVWQLEYCRHRWRTQFVGTRGRRRNSSGERLPQASGQLAEACHWAPEIPSALQNEDGACTVCRTAPMIWMGCKWQTKYMARSKEIERKSSDDMVRVLLRARDPPATTTRHRLTVAPQDTTLELDRLRTRQQLCTI